MGENFLQDGTNAEAKFLNPFGISSLSSNVFLITDGNAIRRLTFQAPTNWVISTVAGKGEKTGTADGTNAYALFKRPQNLRASTSDRVFVADTDNHAIRQIDISGTNYVVTTIAGDKGWPNYADGSGTNALFNSPHDLVVVNPQEIFVCDTYNHVIRRLHSTGSAWQVTTIAGSPRVPGSADGTNTNARFNLPAGLTADPDGNLYVSDFGNHLIRKVSRDGNDWTVSTIAGTPLVAGHTDGTNGTALFRNPWGIAVDNTRTVYVADNGNNLVRQLKPRGADWVVTTVAGDYQIAGSADGVGSQAQFDHPQGLTLGYDESLLLTDNLNFTVRQGQVAPLIQASRRDLTLVLSWPVRLTNYFPQSLNPLLSNSAWTLATNPITSTEDLAFQTNTLGPGLEFFRLYKAN